MAAAPPLRPGWRRCRLSWALLSAPQRPGPATPRPTTHALPPPGRTSTTRYSRELRIMAHAILGVSLSVLTPVPMRSQPRLRRPSRCSPWGVRSQRPASNQGGEGQRGRHCCGVRGGSAAGAWQAAPAVCCSPGCGRCPSAGAARPGCVGAGAQGWSVRAAATVRVWVQARGRVRLLQRHACSSRGPPHARTCQDGAAKHNGEQHDGRAGQRAHADCHLLLRHRARAVQAGDEDDDAVGQGADHGQHQAAHLRGRGGEGRGEAPA